MPFVVECLPEMLIGNLDRLGGDILGNGFFDCQQTGFVSEVFNFGSGKALCCGSQLVR